MPPANETQIPVSVLNAAQLACLAAVVLVGAAGTPAVDIDLSDWFGVIETAPLFDNSFGGSYVLAGTIACVLLGSAQTWIRDPARGTQRRKYGIAVTALAVIAGLATAYWAYRVGFAPLDVNIKSRPRTATYVGVCGAVGFASLAIVRLTRFFESEPAPPAEPAPAPAPPTGTP
jgi:hypothetical protein